MTARTPAPLYGLLLGGGASKRMQRDKAALEYHGEPQLLHAWRLLEAVTERAFVSVREDQRDDPLRAQLPQLVDTWEASSPAAGILTAQDRHPEAAWLVLACDLPLLDAATLDRLIASRNPDADATAFRSRFDDLPEPLCAIWEPSSHALLSQRLREDKYCPRKALILSDTHLLPPPGQALDNVNTPQEFDAMRRAMESTT
jgi:molybdenum cofactor guanylyltransferase